MTPLRHIAELTMVYSIPTISIVDPKSRISNLQQRLQKRANIPLKPVLARLPTYQRRKISEWMYELEMSTGWSGKKIHIATVICFCAEMIDRSPHKFDWEIVLLLADIVDHLEAAKCFYPLCAYGGITAANKWEKIVKRLS